MYWTNPVKGRKTSPYGMRKGTLHGGQDIAPPVSGQQGVKVLAAYPGVVTAAKTGALKGHTGIGVLINHGIVSGRFVSTYYGHLARATVSAGQKVKTGDVVGIMGYSGNTWPAGLYGTHLHFGVLQNGVLVDPVPFMAARGVALGTDEPVVDVSGVTTPGWTPAVGPVLINERLALMGIRTAGGPTDYDREAVRTYQRGQLFGGLKADGLWGPATEAHYQWTVKLQSRLVDIGCRLNRDGHYGKVTRENLINAQRQLGLKPDGFPGPITCARLGIEVHP